MIYDWFLATDTHSKWLWKFQLLFILKGFFSDTIFQEKAENKDTIWESKTTFIIDFKDQSNK